ncbi:MAG: anthranilate synthase component I family protein [Verrucomicrobiota bacterium]|nr:anthranilate synthase component I family protein [Verrucomicrobiota bacterium]
MFVEISSSEAIQTRKQLELGRHFCFLDSSMRNPTAGRYSIIAANPVEVVTGSVNDQDSFERVFAHYRLSSAPEVPFPLGAAIGYVTYEGNYWFGFYPSLLILDHLLDKNWVVRADRLDLTSSYAPRQSGSGVVEALRDSCSESAFIEKVLRAQEYIAAGDIYQVNLSHQLSCGWEGDLKALYQSLREISPSHYSAFIDGNGEQILSSSPELFLRISGRHAVTRPIKGTRPRFRDPIRDEQSAYELIRSEKDLAELVMITDLERNDLGKICEYGSVHTTDLVRLEKYAHVFHLVSTIEGTLREGLGHFKAMTEMFPGGSITGAPKIRAMEIIRELEQRPRGVYTGCLGYLGFNDESCLNIAIRSMVCRDNEISFGIGAGVTIESNAALEYQETMHKACGMLYALNGMGIRSTTKA